MSDNSLLPVAGDLKLTADKDSSVQEIPELVGVDSLPPFDSISHGQVFSISLSNNTYKYTHALHRFAAKYIPQVPSWAIENFTPTSGYVFDPFMGSGTTLLEAKIAGVPSAGTDIDPLARLISRAKVSFLDPQRIEALANDIQESWQPSGGRCEAPILGVENFGHWFTEEAWVALNSLKKEILKIECSSDERNFLLCVFSSIIRFVSRADDQSHKTYVSGTLKKNPPGVEPAFWKAFDRAINALREIRADRLPDVESNVLRGDALDVPLIDDSCDLIVTSPPYLDSVDYMYNFMLEYFWLGPELGVPDRRTFNSMRREAVGAKNPASREVDLPEELKNLIDYEHIIESRQRAVAAYFKMMDAHFKEAARVLREGGRYVLVVGNSKTKNLPVPVHDSLIQIANKHGLVLEKAFAYRIRRHYMKFPRKGRGGIILLDWVIVLRKERQPELYVAPLPNPNLTVSEDSVAH